MFFTVKLQICRILSSDFSDGWGEFVAWWCGVSNLLLFWCSRAGVGIFLRRGRGRWRIQNC